MVLGCQKKNQKKNQKTKTKERKKEKNLNECQKIANQTEDNLPHD